MLTTRKLNLISVQSLTYLHFVCQTIKSVLDKKFPSVVLSNAGLDRSHLFGKSFKALKGNPGQSESEQTTMSLRSIFNARPCLSR